MRRIILCFFLLAAMFLMGCTPKEFFEAASKTGQIIWDPSKPVGSQEDQPSKVSLSLYATDTANPNPYSAPPKEEEKPYEVKLDFTAQSQEEMRAQLQAALAVMEEEVPTINQKMTWQECDRTKNPICDYINYKFTNKYFELMNLQQPNGPLFNIPQFAYQKEEDLCRAFTYPGQYLQDGRPDPLVITLDDSSMKPADAWNRQDPAFLRAIATPISFKVLQLKDDSLFLDADHDTLSADMKAALGTTYISHDDYVLTPAQFKYIPHIELDKNTRFIAVYADFYELEDAVWKGVVEVQPTGGRTFHLISVFQGNQVSLQEEGAMPK